MKTKIRNFTKGGIQILEIAVLKTASTDFRYVAVLKGYLQPIMFNEFGVNEEANTENENDDLNLVLIDLP
jgi:hypothetical protein